MTAATAMAEILPDACTPPLLGPADMTGTWWVVRTAARHEKRVAASLASCDGVGHYLPLYPDTVRYERVTRTLILPLFKKYLFACVADDDAYYAMLDLRRRIPSSLHEFIPVKNQKRLVRELAALHHIVSTGGEVKPYTLPVVGQRVRIADGPWRGHYGRIVSTANQWRFVLEVSFLGGAELQIEPSKLEVVE